MNDYRTRDMMGYRMRNVLIAAALAILAVALTIIYTTHAKKSVAASNSAPVHVLVAARDIPIGTSGKQLAGFRLARRRRRSSRRTCLQVRSPT